MPGRIAQLIRIVERGTVSQQAAKRVLTEIAAHDGDPREIAERLGLLQIGDTDQVTEWIDATLRAAPEEVRRYQGGETRLLGFFIGAVMKQSGGRADPKRVHSILIEKLADPLVAKETPN